MRPARYFSIIQLSNARVDLYLHSYGKDAEIIRLLKLPRNLLFPIFLDKKGKKILKFTHLIYNLVFDSL